MKLFKTHFFSSNQDATIAFYGRLNYQVLKLNPLMLRNGDHVIEFSSRYPGMCTIQGDGEVLMDMDENIIKYDNSTILKDTANEIKDEPSQTTPRLSRPISEVQKKIAILTSGGDSCGMNASVRAVVRSAYNMNMIPYAIYDGYQGMVEGNIKQLNWTDVQGWLSLGGTNIGTARCAAFREYPGRLEAAFHLINNGIDALVVNGGDGSLTGADILRNEWSQIVSDLLKSNRISPQAANKYATLKIVGLVGSIDNDMCLTDYTIGCISALHRIIESIDAIQTTAISHKRAFVIEVMGRHCGWLALMTAIAVNADWLFIPEHPVLYKSWDDAMFEHLSILKEMNQRKLIIILSEGAIDKDLNPIKSSDVQQVIRDRLFYDCRVTVLGHVQRGGVPCFFDRCLATIQGVKAVETILNNTYTSPLIGIKNNEITVEDLVEAVATTKKVSHFIEIKDFKNAMDLRDPQFVPTLKSYFKLSAPRIISEDKKNAGIRIGVMHVGAPCGGMNMAAAVLCKYSLNRGHTPIGIFNGFQGLMQGNCKELVWTDVAKWTITGGSALGTNRFIPKTESDLGLLSYQLQKHDINALLIIGGFEAFSASELILKHRNNYPSFNIPISILPATVSNNVPGTDYSLGCDTALNVIVESCDRIKQSASASSKRVFIVEVQGGNVGFLATMGALAGGATTSYIKEEGINLEMIQKDIKHLQRLYTNDLLNEGRVILRNENVSDTYSTETLSNIIREEANGLFDSRTAILGHLQQGGLPSPMDRIRSAQLATLTVEWFEMHATRSTVDWMPKIYNNDMNTIAVIGGRGDKNVFTPVHELLASVDMKSRKSEHSWWMKYRPLIKELSKYEYFE
eukprot:NODE_39_length_29903_cov_0.529057.p2 type:complete len:853 gc:universal NODE_39_length_29903_cov_0.529057:15327-17885(+)